MAVHKFIDGYISINGVNLSAWAKSITLDTGVDKLDDTFMGDTTRSNLGGLLTWSVKVDFGQDYAAATVDPTLSPLHGTTTAIEVRPTSGSASATNPKWTGTALVDYKQPVGGQVGELHMTSVELASAGSLTRATS
jgi:hypothetical protein